MQKEKEQQDKLNAVKARLLYGDESGRNPRNHAESHYSESKTATARTEPRRRHGSKHSRSPSPIASPPQFPREGNRNATKEASSQGHIAPRQQQIFGE
ncbi:hypothetical protein Tco_0107220 [Tanacetum coccineum]